MNIEKFLNLLILYLIIGCVISLCMLGPQELSWSAIYNILVWPYLVLVWMAL